MTRRHGDKQGLNVDVLAVDRGANAVAEDQAIGVEIVLVPGGEDAVLASRGHGQQALDMLLILVIGLDVPEGDGGVGAVRLGVRIDHRVGEKGPLVVWPDVGKIDEGVDGESDAQGAALPGTCANLLPGHLERPEVFAKRTVELNNVCVTVFIAGGGQRC